MYYLYIDQTPTETWYCLAKANTRTTWELALPLALSKPLDQLTEFHTFKGTALLYSGPTIPAIDTHPELFI